MKEQSRRARLVGALTAVGGIIYLITALPWANRFRPTLDPFVPFGLEVTGALVSALVGLALLYLAGQLRRRRRLAWTITTVVFAAAFVVDFFRPQGALSTTYAAAMLLLLIVSRSKFTAPGDPPTLFELLRFLPRYIAFVFVYGMITLWVSRNEVTPSMTWSRNFETILLGLVGVDGPYTYKRDVFSWAFPLSLLAFGIIGLVTIVALIFRPIIARPIVTDAVRENVKDILHNFSFDTLDYFSLRDDKLYFVSSDEKAFIAYTYVGRYALVSGDPIGDAQSIPLVVDEFLAMCKERAWGVSFLAVRESDQALYRQRGLNTVYLGDEAVIDVRGFRLEGKKWKSIRQSSGRVERTYRFVWMNESEASPQLLSQLNAISTRWRGKKPERGFTMTLNQDVNGANPDFRLCIALDENDTPGGFLRIVPIYGDRKGFTLDLMRRDPDTPNGMTEFLLTRTIMAMDAAGYERLSMNFAAWGRFFESDIDYTFLQRVAKIILNILSPFYQIRSLKEFNQRFYPQWVPRCIAYEGFRTLPRVALLYSSVEGLLTIPFIGKYLLPKTVLDPTHPVLTGEQRKLEE